MSADGIRISYISSKSRELAGYMADTLDEDWKNRRGMEIVSVALASISYDEESQKLIQMRNQGAMMGDPSIREGYMQSAVARGLEAGGFQRGRQRRRLYGHGIWHAGSRRGHERGQRRQPAGRCR